MKLSPEDATGHATRPSPRRMASDGVSSNSGRCCATRGQKPRSADRPELGHRICKLAYLLVSYSSHGALTGVDASSEIEHESSSLMHSGNPAFTVARFLSNDAARPRRDGTALSEFTKRLLRFP
jgi:hypothetical protein